MKVYIFIIASIVATRATPPVETGGISSQFRTQDASGAYDFGYDESHSGGGSYRREYGDTAGNKYGSYGLTDADGRQRTVNYIADQYGFRASIKSNEPGVEEKDPASTSIRRSGVFVSSPTKSGVFVAVPEQTQIRAPAPAKSWSLGKQSVTTVRHHPYYPYYPRYPYYEVPKIADDYYVSYPYKGYPYKGYPYYERNPYNRYVYPTCYPYC